MGCNIHLHIEIKIDNKWEHFGCPYMPRNYRLYGRMAGVRIEVEPIVEPKGIPDDITLITRIDYEHEDSHHSSWFNVEEIEQLEKWMRDYADTEKDKFQWYPGAEFYLFMEQMTGYLFRNGFHPQKVNDIEIQDIRFVFWFDN